MIIKKIFEFFLTISFKKTRKKNLATPFKINASNNKDNNFDNIIQYNNNTNSHLPQIGTHLHKIENLIKPPFILTSSSSNISLFYFA